MRTAYADGPCGRPMRTAHAHGLCAGRSGTAAELPPAALYLPTLIRAPFREPLSQSGKKGVKSGM
jgi:hypothetical protein